jgi:hypothetical protein
MATIRNPLDFSTTLDLTDAIQQLTPEFGAINNSGLFRKKGTTEDAVLYEINQGVQSTMVGLTSRRERDTVKNARGRKKQQALYIPYMKHSDQITRDDVKGIVRDWKDLTVESVTDLYVEKLASLKRNFEQSHEYMAITAAQGVTRDPLDGSVIVDMFALNGVTQTEVTWDFTNPDFDIIAAVRDLKERTVRANVWGGSISSIDVVVGSNLFTKIVSHPQFAELYVMAMSGRGQEAINNSRPWADVVMSQYGITSSFTFDGVRFMTYPSTFRNEDGEAVNVVEANEGFTIVRGLTGMYEARFAGDNNLDSIGQVGQPIFAWRTPLVERYQFEIICESAPLYYATHPELIIKLNGVV